MTRRVSTWTIVLANASERRRLGLDWGWYKLQSPTGLVYWCAMVMGTVHLRTGVRGALASLDVHKRLAPTAESLMQKEATKHAKFLSVVDSTSITEWAMAGFNEGVNNGDGSIPTECTSADAECYYRGYLESHYD